MTLWIRPAAFYWQGRIHLRVSVALHDDYPVEITETPLPEAIPLPGLLSPAWVNAHTHLELSHLHRQISPGLGMIAFLHAMGPNRGQATPATIYQALEEAYQEGTAAFVSHQNVPLPSEAIPPGVVVQPLSEFFGLHPRVRRSRYRAAQRLGYPLTPHSAYALSRGLHRLARRYSPFPKSLHFYESWEEKLWLEAGRGPFRGFLQQFYRRPYRPPLRKLLYRLARRAPALWLVHVTEMPMRSLSYWLSRIPNLYLVLCPLANWHLFRREPPLRQLRPWAHRILLGTDSLANALTLSLWPTLRHLYQSGWDWPEILQAAADNPRQWLSMPPTWSLISPLSDSLSLLPTTRAQRWQP
jgi:cytosine/adenosine deaminase-related metal-dependent hydrolase